MAVNKIIFDELIKRGHSRKKNVRVWDISDSKLWYLTPELSKGFLKLAKSEPYRKAVVDRELNLLNKSTNSIVSFFGEKEFNLIDLGSGWGKKTKEFIRRLPPETRLRYCPVDISPYFIRKTITRLKTLKTKKIVAFKPFVLDFKKLDEIVGILKNKVYKKDLILLLGETISHYEINEFLFKISKDMHKGDVLIIGNGFRVGKRFVNIEKYRSSLFNEWFIHIMYGLGFLGDEVSYNARFANNRLETYYKVLVDKKVKYKNKTVVFKEGDEIIVGIQHKYYENELKKFGKMYFSKVEFLPDRKTEYALILCKK